jgi:uncharacterized membrane protein
MKSSIKKPFNTINFPVTFKFKVVKVQILTNLFFLFSQQLYTYSKNVKYTSEAQSIDDCLSLCCIMLQQAHIHTHILKYSLNPT